MTKEQIIRILENRATKFQSINNSYEAREVRSAIDTIKRLVPPELFAIHDVVEQSEQLPKRLSNEAYKKAKTLRYEAFVEWWDRQ